MDKKKPLVSVIMPAYNAGNFLRLSIESILSQTYRNLELIIINDASTDNTREIASFYKRIDGRVRVFSNKKNCGVSKSASLGISKAKGKFIARMDADDVSLPTRIEKQVRFLQKNQDVVALGGQCELINAEGVKTGKKEFPQDDKTIREMVFTAVPLQQPTLMVNKELLPNGFVWYDENYTSAEELELMFKLFRFGKVRNLKDVLLKYRMHGRNTSLINPKKTFYLTLRTRIISILKYGYLPSAEGVLITLVEAVFVALVPNSWVYPVYSYLRGLRKITLRGVNINWDVSTIFKKALQVAEA